MPAASSSLRRNASPLAGRACRRRRSSSASSLASRRNTSGCGSGVSNRRPTASQARAAASSVAACSRSERVGGDRVHARDRVQVAATLVQDQRGRGRTARAGPRTGCGPAARPWRSPPAGRIRACTDAGCDPPRRSGSSAARSPRSSAIRPSPRPALYFHEAMQARHPVHHRRLSVLHQREGAPRQARHRVRGDQSGKRPGRSAELVERTGMFTFPQIVIGDETIGGFDELLAADRAGRLSELARGVAIAPPAVGPRPCARTEPSRGRPARGFGWQCSHTYVPRPPTTILRIVLPHRGHGSPARRWTRNRSWKEPRAPSTWRKSSIEAPLASIPALSASSIASRSRSQSARGEPAGRRAADGSPPGTAPRRRRCCRRRRSGAGRARTP